MADSSVVYRMDLATTNVQVVHDFGAAGIARDVQVSGNRLVAIVGAISPSQTTQSWDP